MRKFLSAILCICLLATIVPFAAFADGSEGVIIKSVNDETGVTWTYPEGCYVISSNDYGSDVPNKFVAPDSTGLGDLTPDKNNADTTYVTYSEIPEGVYEVSYYYPGFANETNRTGRNAQVLDTDVEITHAHGTKTITSTKPKITAGDVWVSLGTYEFNGESKIKAYANQDNKYFKGTWNRRFLSSQVKFTPVTTDLSALLSAVNSASDTASLKTAVLTNSNGFVNTSALKYMGGVYEKLLNDRPTVGYSSAYAFKTAFENAVESQLVTSTVSSSSFVWQANSSAVTSNGYRINWPPVELGNGDGACAIVTFNVGTGKNIKSMKLKLNKNDLTATDGLSNVAKITKYSSSEITLPNSNKEQNKTMMASAVFTDLDTNSEIPVSVSQKEISDSAIVSAANGSGYISFYIVGDEITYGGSTFNNKYAINASLEIICDNTTDTSMNITEADVNSKAKNTAKVFDLAGFDSVSSVSVNETALASDKYSVKDTRLKIDGSVFNAEGTYEVAVSNGSESRSVMANVSGDKILDTVTLTGTATAKSFNADEWNFAGTTLNAWEYGSSNTSENTYVTYNNVPEGEYEVYYTVPSFASTSVPNKRNISILDTGVSVTDKHGTTVTESTKDSVSGGRFLNLGTYEFNGTSDQIKVYVNEEHKNVKDGQYDPFFFPGGITLKPASNGELINYYYENGKTYLQAINDATSSSELMSVLTSNSFVDTAVLSNMSVVYDELAGKDFVSVYAFKKAFNEEVNKNIRKETYTAQVLSANTSNAIRGLTVAQTLNRNYYLVATFKDVNKSNVIGADIKLNISQIRVDAQIASYSYDKYDRTYNDALDSSNGYFDAANTFVTTNFTSLASPIAVSMADSVSIGKELFSNMTEDKYISFRFEPCGGILTENTNASLGNEYSSENTVVMTVYYDTTVLDKTSAAQQIASADTISAAKTLTQTHSTILGLGSEDNKNAVAVALFGEEISTESDVDALIAKAKAGGIIVSKAEYSDDGVSVTVKNFDSETKTIQLIAASYTADNNIMNGAKMDSESSITGENVYTVTLSLTKKNTTDKVKVFTLNSLTNLSPLTTVFPVTQ